MMKRMFFMLLFLGVQSVFAQQMDESIVIVGKPIDPKKEFSFLIAKKEDEIRIKYTKVDSIGKLDFSNEDMTTIRRLLKKDKQFFDALSNDSLNYLQSKLETTRLRNTYFRIDSTTIYKSTHPDYWKLMQTILKSPSAVLEKMHGVTAEKDGTYCFFTITQQGQNRYVHIDQLDEKLYPLLSKLVNVSFEIMSAHQIVKTRKNH